MCFPRESLAIQEVILRAMAKRITRRHVVHRGRCVTPGIYSVVRNPSYLGLLVNALGWGLAFRSAIGVLLAILNVLPLVARIRSEETLLESQFGSQYEAYRARTSRLPLACINLKGLIFK